MLNAALKRTLDVAGALALGLATAPILALAALAVRLTMGAPVLYRQVRAGRDGRLFTLVKLRTMRPTAPGEDALASDGARLTPLGRFLRATSLDELPQLWNVLHGDMALVGPRPLLPEYLPRYSPEQARRHAVRPGLTGLAQVRGRNGLDWPERLALDVWYVDHQSLRLDVAILVATATAVFRRDGVSAAGHATMPEFQGAPK
jgi:lipopolysaccharide/colanic/teichoic acid biosynthesis glycosyltransferase